MGVGEGGRRQGGGGRSVMVVSIIIWRTAGGDYSYRTESDDRDGREWRSSLQRQAVVSLTRDPARFLSSSSDPLSTPVAYRTHRTQGSRVHGRHIGHPPGEESIS